LNQFFRTMGHTKLRFRPHYFPYTEPSVEIDSWIDERKVWMEIGGAGMFRPEVTIPFFGRHIPVLAWGPGFDRIIMQYFEIKDLRDFYKNNLTKSREMRFWAE
jgi:phenylalanyl-tRNA synthetase alpha chain